MKRLAAVWQGLACRPAMQARYRLGSYSFCLDSFATRHFEGTRL